MAVAGPDRSGSGRGVPVPSMTTRVEPFAFVASRASCVTDIIDSCRRVVARWRAAELCASSIDAHAGGLNHLGPALRIGLDTRFGFGTPGPVDQGVLRAQSLLKLRRSQRLLDLALQ